MLEEKAEKRKKRGEQAPHCLPRRLSPVQVIRRGEKKQRRARCWPFLGAPPHRCLSQSSVSQLLALPLRSGRRRADSGEEGRGQLAPLSAPPHRKDGREKRKKNQREETLICGSRIFTRSAELINKLHTYIRAGIIAYYKLAIDISNR